MHCLPIGGLAYDAQVGSQGFQVVSHEPGWCVSGVRYFFKRYQKIYSSKQGQAHRSGERKFKKRLISSYIIT